MPNEYSERWFRTWMTTVPDEWTQAEVEGVTRRLPLPEFCRVLDVCCGPGRHAASMSAAGYSIVGVDRDEGAIAQARRVAPAAHFSVGDQRAVRTLEGPFDAAMILWQSFGYFDPSTNNSVLEGLAAVLRPGGRLLLDVYHPGWVAAHAGRTTRTRSADCLFVDNEVIDGRLRSTSRYADGTVDVMDFELFEPQDLADRAAHAGFELIEACCWWDDQRPPDSSEQRYQLVLVRLAS